MYTLCKCLRQSEIISNRQNSYSRKHKHIMKVQCIGMWLFIVANTDATSLKSKHVLLMLNLNIHVYIHSVVFGGRNRTRKNPTCVASWSILSKHVLLNLLYIHIYSVVFGGMNWTWKSPTCFASWGNYITLLLNLLYIHIYNVVFGGRNQTCCFLRQLCNVTSSLIPRVFPEWG